MTSNQAYANHIHSKLRNRKLIQMSDKMCPVEWDTKEFESMMTSHLKKDEDEWRFYDKLVQEWNTEHSAKKSLSAFLKFMIDRVALEFTK